MMRLVVFNTLLFLVLLLSISALAQPTTLRGRVREASTGQPVAGCEVYVRGSRQIARTDSAGRFELSGLAAGRHLVQLSSLGHELLKTEVETSSGSSVLEFSLARRERTLQEVVVAAPQSTFGQTRLREVEGMAIFAAKKSEVIVPDNLVANLATNNARQVYARVAGLNIWENDGGGLQLSIGGRGLSPDRSANFNVRQNGYDISADALGYPESYYTPPIEAIKRIQLVRGAASLQYGTQFGGLLNFELRPPVADKTVSVTARQTVGSFGFFNSFNSVSGSVKGFSYYAFAQYKRGDGWRPNSHFESKTAYADLRYQFTENFKMGTQMTHMGYLAQQPGGLNDERLHQNPRQSNRARNWFQVDWNLFNLNADWKLTPQANINLTAFGLLASRESLGFRPNNVTSSDNDANFRDLVSGDFRNYGVEARYLKRYRLGPTNGVLLLGTRYYRGYNHSIQGLGPAGREADFRFVDPTAGLDRTSYSDYEFPNHNLAAFAENIFYFGDKVSLTPGLRYEYIRTRADGYYGTVFRDNAGNVIENRRTNEQRSSPRGLLLAGIGLSYKARENRELYANISQNYRSITFSDMRITNASAVIDPNLEDERGYSADLGLRGDQAEWLTYDLSLFALRYGNRIGEVQTYDQNNRVLRLRSNIGAALVLGVESYAEAELLRLRPAAGPAPGPWAWSVFGNAAFIYSRYTESQIKDVLGNDAIAGKQVEYVPAVNLKTGTRLGYGPLKASFQFTYLSDQFSEATNTDASVGDMSAVVGRIPAYRIMDVSLSWERRWLKLEASVNNLTNTIYFTRRATGYPGPGILPSDGRSYFLTVGVKW